MRRTRLTWQDREIHNRAARAAAWVFLLVCMAWVLFVVMPIALLLHWPLRLLGRRGTVDYDGRHLSVELGVDAFRRRA